MPERDDPIFLVGFMGAGKSVSGALLARRLGWDFIDLDRLVIDRERRSIADVFALDGEVGFRQAELRALDTLQGRRRLVVACGGGTYSHPEGSARIDAMGRAVWIDVPLSTSVERCASLPVRPLLRDRAQIESLYRARLPAYRRAPYRVEAVDATPEEIAGRIFALLCSAG
jgi:shikimate kinase